MKAHNGMLSALRYLVLSQQADLLRFIGIISLQFCPNIELRNYLNTLPECFSGRKTVTEITRGSCRIEPRMKSAIRAILVQLSDQWSQGIKDAIHTGNESLRIDDPYFKNFRRGKQKCVI